MSMQQTITQKLEQSFKPSHIEVMNESYQHNVPEGSESHFKVIIVSEKFASLSAVKRHQSVYATLQQEMQSIHALSLHTFTPEEWQQKPEAIASPRCRGGSAKEKRSEP